MISITYLITELSVGGAQMALYRLLSSLDRTRFDPLVIALYNGDGQVAQQIRELNIPVTDLNMDQNSVQAIPRLYNLLHTHRPIFLHTWLFHANLLGRLLGKSVNIPCIICSERTMEMESVWRYRVNRWTIAFVDQVITVSDNVRQFYIDSVGLPEAKVMTIPNGVIFGQFTRPNMQRITAPWVPDSRLSIGVVSRLDPVKGIDVLLKSVEQSHNINIVIIGDGPERHTLEILAHRLGITESVYWLGYQENVPAWLSTFDLFIQPSLHEGMPNVVLEAMAAGLPVVATAVGGTPEVVVHGETGLLVPPGNPVALANAMTELLQNPARRATMGEAGRKRVEAHFSIAETVRKTEKLYEDLYEQWIKK